MKPSTADVSRALQEIETAELPDDHPRVLARKALEKWRSDAQRQKLPIANQSDSGAPSLRVDDVIRRSEPNYGRRK